MQSALATRPSPTDPRDLEHLGEQIAELAARITAATFQLLALIRQFDDRQGWNCGFRTCAHWLSWRTGLGLGPAREHVRVARTLAQLPRLSDSMRRGQISYSKVRALTRVATPENEQELLDFARAGTASHVERLVRAWRRVDRIEEREQEALRHASRHLSLWTDEDGMVVVRGRLDPEAGAALLKAVEAGCDVLYDQEKERETATHDGVPPAQRRADALGRVAEAALAGGLDRGTRGDRYQVVVHVDAPVLEEPELRDVPAGTPEENGGKGGQVPIPRSKPPLQHQSTKESVPVPLFRPSGHSAFENGPNLPPETAQRLACDASKVLMTHDPRGNILDISRKTRIISPALRRALTHRDQGCRFPGCGLKFGDAHHVRHWARGGETRLENLVLLCRRHHRCVHEEGYRLERLGDGEFQFLGPDGRVVPEAPAVPELRNEAVVALVESLIEAGVDLERMPGYPEWDGSALDLGWAVDQLRPSANAML